MTPLTELVTRLVGAPADPSTPLDGVSAEQVNAMAAAVTKLMSQFTSDAQLVDILGPVVAINADTFAQASVAAQAYGKVLAALAGGFIFLRNPALATMVAEAFTEKSRPRRR